jgi:hypothetical protein
VEWDEAIIRVELELIGHILPHRKSASARVILLHGVLIAFASIWEKERV